MARSAAAEPVSGTARIQYATDRIDGLLTASATGGVLAQERAEELVHVVVDLYGAGLRRVLEVLDEAGRLDDAALDALAGDELVAGLLLVHGLHPDDVATRVAAALDSVRPYLGSHGGDVELIDISDEGVVRLRLTGSCDGCASSSATLELAVDGAVRDAAPEVTAIEVEQPKATTVIPLSSLRVRTAEPEKVGGWHAVDLADLEVGGVVERTVAGVGVVVCRVGTELFAFRNRCPSCHGPIAGTALARRAGGPTGDAVLRCPGCRHHFDVRHAGAGLDAAEMLDPLPLLARDGEIQVAVPEVATA